MALFDLDVLISEQSVREWLAEHSPQEPYSTGYSTLRMPGLVHLVYNFLYHYNRASDNSLSTNPEKLDLLTQWARQRSVALLLFVENYAELSLATQALRENKKQKPDADEIARIDAAITILSKWRLGGLDELVKSIPFPDLKLAYQEIADFNRRIQLDAEKKGWSDRLLQKPIYEHIGKEAAFFGLIGNLTGNFQLDPESR